MSPMIGHCSKPIMKFLMDEIQMEIEGCSKVLGNGNVELFFTCGKEVTLINVLHVPKMTKNLVSRDLFGKPDIKSMYEFGKLILYQNDIFIGKGYSFE